MNARLLIAGTGSNCGKTWVTIALMRALALRGKKVTAFKCGPDYIDPMFHEKILGIPSRNLDLYFTGKEETKAIFLQEDDSDVSVVEGVMGLYDGLGGIQEEASAMDLAKTLKLPILLIVNAHGKGRSLAAEIAGFLSMDTEHLIQGVLLNRISEGFYGMIKPVIEEMTGTKVFGYLPNCESWKLESRHLGLKLPQEKDDLSEQVTKAAAQLENSVRLDDILEMVKVFADKNPLTAKEFPWLKPMRDNVLLQGGQTVFQRKKVRVGVASDEAFCFYYRDNLRLLENAGAQVIPFSPLRDKCLPEDLDGMLLGGGYPELWARELSGNVSMREQVKIALEGGMPSLAECGGFLYLHEELELENGESYPMAGIVKGRAYYTGRSVRFGYAEFSEGEDALMTRKRAAGQERKDIATAFHIRGHEFHYFESENCGGDWSAKKPVTGRSWKCMHAGAQHLWGFGHLYYPSAPRFTLWFVEKCQEFQRQRNAE